MRTRTRACVCVYLFVTVCLYVMFNDHCIIIVLCSRTQKELNDILQNEKPQEPVTIIEKLIYNYFDKGKFVFIYLDVSSVINNNELCTNTCNKTEDFDF